jgi:hypothetical protein
MTDPPAPPRGPHGDDLATRATAASDLHRGLLGQRAFTRRHQNWVRWIRHAQTAAALAGALGVRIDDVTVTEDPDRPYELAGYRPGPLITVTEPLTGRNWQFLPDLAHVGDSWLLIDQCPGCTARVPTARVATLADLGDYLDATDGEQYDHVPDQFFTDPAHDDTCMFRTPMA